MARHFLDQLPRVQDGELPDGAECMICREKYGTFPSDNGVIEHAVLLPCSHHVGSECIALWLLHETGLGNSCPLCRTVLFNAEATDYDNEDDDEDDQGEGEDSERRGSNEGDEDENGEEEGNDEEGGEGGDRTEEAEDGIEARGQAPTTLRSPFQRLASNHYFITPTHEGLLGQDASEWFRP